MHDKENHSFYTLLNKVIEDLFPVGRSAEFCNRRLDDIIAQISEVKDKVRKVSSHGNDDKGRVVMILIICGEVK